MKRLFCYSLPLALCISVLSYAQDYPPEVKKFLQPGKYINSEHPEIIAKVKELVKTEKDVIKKAKILFEFVRDEIREGFIDSMRASDVLAQGEGVCHEKASLLTALARAAGIPAYYGFTVVHIKNWRNEEGKIDDIKFLHGATGLYLKRKWILYDPTGNIHRWKLWVQDDLLMIKLPLEFSVDHDVIFPTIGKVTVEKTPHKLFDHDIHEKIRIGKLYGIEYSLE